MSETRSGGQQQQQAAGSRREKIRVSIERLKRSRQRSSIIGVPEAVGLAASALLLIAVIFAYFYFYMPASSRLVNAQNERDRLQRLIQSSTLGVKRSSDTQATLTEITQSLDDFEVNHLASRTAGRLELLDRLNQLIKANALRNTSGPTYTPLEAIDPNAPKTSASRTGSARLQSVYPGIGVTVTVEGAYPNVRRFLRDIEASNQFIVLNSVEIESVTDTNSPSQTPTSPVTGEEGSVAQTPGAPGAAPTARSSLVSLRVNMAAYFQREAGQSAGDETNQTP